MKQTSKVYAIVFYMSIGITVILLSIMLLQMRGDSTEPEEKMIPDIVQNTKTAETATTAAIQPKTIEITETELKNMLSPLLKETTGFEIDTLFITNDFVTIMSKASKEDIRSRITESGIELSKALDVALKIAPETVEIDADIRMITNHVTQKIELTITKLTVLGFNVPVGLMPDSFSETISAFLNDARDAYGLRELTVTLENGKLIISGI